MAIDGRLEEDYFHFLTSTRKDIESIMLSFFFFFFFNTSIAFDRVIISHRIAGSAPARACKQLRHLQVVSIERPDLLYTKSAEKLDIEGINGPFFSIPCIGYPIAKKEI